MKKKLIKTILCVIGVMVFVLSSFSVSFGQTDYSLSGDQRADIVKIAKSCEGMTLPNAKKNLKKYGKSLWNESYDYDWCAWFISNCAVEAGVKKSVFPRDTFANGFYKWAKNNGRYKAKSKYTPKPGDVALCGSANGTYHVELVASVSGSTVKCIGGNTGNDYWKNATVSKPRTRNDIYGYVSVNYPAPSFKHVVEFSSNGGRETYSSQTLKNGEEIKIPAQKPTRDGYVFLGYYAKRLKDQTWYVSGTGWLTEGKIGNKSRKLYPAGGTYKINDSWTKGETKSNYRFYAQWKEAKITVKFNSNQGTGTMAQKTLAYKGSSIKVDTVNEFKKEGYAFNGWKIQRIHAGKTFWIVPNGKDWVWKENASVEERKLYKNADTISFGTNCISPDDTIVFWASYKDALKGTQTIEDGTYYIAAAADPDFVLDVYKAGDDNGTNVQLYKNYNNENQKFDVEYLGDGYYSILSYTGKAVDVAGASAKNRTNVQIWNSVQNDAQKWIIKDLGDGSYSIHSKCSGGGLCLDIAGGNISNGTNIWTFYENGGNAQKWTFVPVEDKEEVEPEEPAGGECDHPENFVDDDTIDDEIVDEDTTDEDTVDENTYDEDTVAEDSGLEDPVVVDPETEDPEEEIDPALFEEVLSFYKYLKENGLLDSFMKDHN